MRRTIPAAMAVLLSLAAAPVLAQEADPSLEPAELQRAEAPEFGVAMQLPAEWRVSKPEGLRLSALTTADDEPVMETTALYANGGGGTWCDMDVYLALDAPLDSHAYQYAAYLQQSEDPEVAMIVVDTELPLGPAFRIELFDQSTGRMRAMYLFDGPAADDGTFNRFLFTCAAREATEPFWETLASSIEVFPPMPAEESTEDETAAEETPATD